MSFNQRGDAGKGHPLRAVILFAQDKKAFSAGTGQDAIKQMDRRGDGTLRHIVRVAQRLLHHRP